MTGFAIDTPAGSATAAKSPEGLVLHRYFMFANESSKAQAYAVCFMDNMALSRSLP